MDQELEKLLEQARQRQMKPEELTMQRVSFAYGNAPKGDTNTKDTVYDALTEARVS